jgi:hypothetical protein
MFLFEDCKFQANFFSLIYDKKARYFIVLRRLNTKIRLKSGLGNSVIDSPSANLEDHDFLGFAETNLAQIVAAGHNSMILQLLQNKSKYYPILPKQAKQSKGTIILLAEELVQYKEEVCKTFLLVVQKALKFVVNTEGLTF